MGQLHEGHRGRLRRRLQAEGLEGFEAHEVMELLLYTSIPLRDVNPLAHLLIERFGTVDGVLRAPREALLAVPGVGEKTCDWLELISGATRHYASLRLSDRPMLNSFYAVGEYCRRLFGAEDARQLWLFGMNLAGHLLYSECLGAGDARAIGIRRALEPALRSRAQTVILVSRRAPGETQPSAADLSFAAEFSELLSRIRVLFMDSVIYSSRGIVSLRDAGLLNLTADGALREGEALKLYEGYLSKPIS